MKKLILPVFLALTGLGGGIAAGLALRPDNPDADAIAEDGSEPPAEAGGGHGTETPAKAEAGHGGESGSSETEFVKLENQFVVPVIAKDRVESLVLLSLTLETPVGGKDLVFAREPKLRDALLQVLFDHANTGGFRETFTDTANMLALRRALREAAQGVLGRGQVRDVLIIDILRQDA